MLRQDVTRDWVYHAFEQPVYRFASGGQDRPYPHLSTLEALDQLRIQQGPLKNTYLLAPGGYVNWYFANIGLLHFVEERPEPIRAYIDAYLDFVRPDGTIWDVAPDWFNWNGGNPIHIAPDSHDSYAASLLELVGAWHRVTGDTAWVKARMPRFKFILKRNLLDSQDPVSGLVRTFQNPQEPVWSPGVQYLMDNCEVYSGLDSFGRMLQSIQDPDASLVLLARDRVGQGIRDYMFRPAQGAWAHAAQANSVGVGFYPYSTAQAFPILHRVPVPNAYLQAGWDYAESTTEQWWRAGRHDIFPWLAMAYAAALMGDEERASAMMNSTYKYVRANPQFFIINELGFWHGLTKRL